MAGISHQARRYGYKIKHRFRQDPFSAVILYSVVLGLFFMLFAFRGMLATLFIRPLGIINPSDQNTDSNANTPETDAANQAAGFSLKSSGVYTVKSGDTLSSIADALKISRDELASLNDLKPPYSLVVGQELKIPSKD